MRGCRRRPPLTRRRRPLLLARRTLPLGEREDATRYAATLWTDRWHRERVLGEPKAANARIANRISAAEVSKKRISAGGSSLRAKQDAQQLKTFTRWCNGHLKKHGTTVTDLIL